jgi:hypothetical protein
MQQSYYTALDIVCIQALICISPCCDPKNQTVVSACLDTEGLLVYAVKLSGSGGK